MSNKRALSVLVPCYNESATVELLLTRLRKELPDAEIIVVDDASTDDSPAIINQICDSLNLTVICRESNGGKGAAVQSGLAVATGHWVAIQDADLEYDPSDLSRMLDHARSNSDSDGIVYGSRYLISGKANGGLWSAYVATQLISWVQWLLFGKWLSDPLTCYKLLPTDLLRRLDLCTCGFELCGEINAKLLGSGKQIMEIPISYHPRSYAEGKKIGPWDFVRMIATIVRFRFANSSTFSQSAVSSQAERKFNRWYAGSRVAIAGLLLIAGLGKAAAGQPLVLGSLWIIPASVITTWGVLEIFVGWAALTMVPRRSLRRMVTAMFSVFALALLVNWGSGANQCQCLGGSAVPITVMFALDVVILFSLYVLRDHWDHQVVSASGVMGDLIQNLKIAAPVLLVGATVWFGSLGSAVGYLGGRSLLVDSSGKFAGEVVAGEKVFVAFQLRNTSTSPIRILGAKASCRCVAIEDLPITVHPSQTESIRVSINAAPKSGLQQETARLICNDSASELTLRVTALVHSNPQAVDATLVLGEN